jgi:hypothetical protein
MTAGDHHWCQYGSARTEHSVLAAAGACCVFFSIKHRDHEQCWGLMAAAVLQSWLVRMYGRYVS